MANLDLGDAVLHASANPQSVMHGWPHKEQRSGAVYHRAVYHSIRLDDPQFASDVGRVIREARVLIGWTQAELATRAATSQSRISRLEADGRADLDVSVLARVLSALGVRGSLDVTDRALDDRRQQRDPVHARLLGYVAQRLSRQGWAVRTEVPIGHPVPRGWIDLVAFRELDRAGLIGEIKGDLPDIGGLQRQVGFYGRSAPDVFRMCGWRAARIGVVVAALDSAQVATRIAANRALLSGAFPGHPVAMGRWLAGESGTPPEPTIAMVNPTNRREEWLLRTPLSGRRSTPRFAAYADASTVLMARRYR